MYLCTLKSVPESEINGQFSGEAGRNLFLIKRLQDK